MISDELKNISKYAEIPKVAIDFFKNLTPDIELGKHILKCGIYANVEIYNTKLQQNSKLEAHEKYIDIQLLLTGVEKLDYTKTDGLEISEKYDDDRDIMFFKTPKRFLNSVYLTGTNFVMLYPKEAHAPQISPDGTCNEVKKVVIKCPL